MIKLSFERAINIVGEKDKIVKLKVVKEGVEAADCYLTFTGTTNYSKAKYPDKAVKSTKGDFYAKNQTLTWEAGNEEPKEVTIEIFSDEEKERAEMFYVTMKSENAEIGIERTYYYIVEDVKSFLSQTAIASLKIKKLLEEHLKLSKSFAMTIKENFYKNILSSMKLRCNHKKLS